MTRDVFSVAVDGQVALCAKKERATLRMPLDRNRRLILGVKTAAETVNTATDIAYLLGVFGYDYFSEELETYCLAQHESLRLLRPLCTFHTAPYRDTAMQFIKTAYPIIYGGSLARTLLRGLIFASSYHWNLFAPSIWAANQQRATSKESKDVLAFARVCEDLAAAYLAAGWPLPTDLVEDVTASLFQREKFQEALDWSLVGLERVDADANALALIIARSRLRLGEFITAQSVVEVLEPSVKNSTQFQLALADAYIGQERYAEAYQVFRNMRPGAAEADEVLLGEKLTRGLAFPLSRHSRTISDLIEAAVETDPSVHRATNILFSFRQYASVETRLVATEAATKNAAFLPPSQRLQLGVAQYKTYHYSQAGINLQKFLEHQPNHAYANMLIGDIESKRQLSYLPPLAELPWDVCDPRADLHSRCVISMEEFAELQNPIVLKKGNGRYLFEYDLFRAHHDRVLKDFFDNGPLDSSSVFRVKPYQKSLRERANILSHWFGTEADRR